MECKSGDCEIVIRFAGSSGSSMAVSDLMQRLNGQLLENPLTAKIMMGLTSVQRDENQDMWAVLVTMPRPPDETEGGNSE